jgi:hypothetical protein
MNIDMYVQSCGISQDQDYHWRKIISQDNQPREIPRILREATRLENGIQIRLTDKYDSQEPTIVLAQDSNELLLLATAMEALERTKIHGYQVRNSVALTTPYSYENEQLLRKIVVQAQQNWEELKNAIDEAVQSDSDAGFGVNPQRIKQYIGKVQNQVSDSKVSPQNPQIKVVWWGISEHVREWDTKKNSQILVAICLLLILILAIALITQILPRSQREETPPTSHSQVAPTVTPSPIPDSQPTQTMLQPQTITMPSASDTSTTPPTEPIKTQQSSPHLEILPMESSQENFLTRDSVQ